MLESPAFWMVPALFALVFLGVPVAFSLIVVAFAFGYPFFGDNLGLQFFGRLHSVATNYILSAVPLFILMGTILERSGIAERLFVAMQQWVGRFPGGLAVAAIAMCAVFAAATGIVGAVETVIGMMAIPPMLKYRYEPGLIAGTICSGGSLGTIIPPTLVVVIYASIVEAPIGDLMAGIVIPGLLMVTFFLIYIIGRCMLRPQDGPPLSPKELDRPLVEKLKLTASAMVPAILLIAGVLGSILAGIASPTEAAGVGALGGILLTIAYGKMSVRLMREVLHNTLVINTMIMFVVLGGTMFTAVFVVNGGNAMVSDLIRSADLGVAGVTTVFLAIVFALGFILDWVSIVLICMPIFAPIVKQMGIDTLWFGVMVCIVIQTSYLTPPMAPAIFYLRSIAPPEITYQHMFRGVIPFIICELLVLAVVAIFPEAATWLPKLIFG
mgnify:CR=1 FL=1